MARRNPPSATLPWPCKSQGTTGHLLNAEFFEQRDNRLTTLLPDASRWAAVVRVLDVPADTHDGTLYLHADCLTQRAVCYLAPATHA